MEKRFDGKKAAKLGTEKNPAVVSVQTEEKRKEVAAKFKAKGWYCKIDLAPEKPEDLTDLDILMNPVKTITAEKTPGRNDACLCGSGQKYKKCCGR